MIEGILLSRADTLGQRRAPCPPPASEPDRCAGLSLLQDITALTNITVTVSTGDRVGSNLLAHFRSGPTFCTTTLQNPGIGLILLAFGSCRNNEQKYFT